jgi:hypothetical protein
MKNQSKVAIVIELIVAIATVAALIPGFGAWLFPNIFPPKMQPSFHDTFDNATFNGSYNSTLWKWSGTGYVKASQENGAMVFSTTSQHADGNNALTPINPDRWSFEDFRFIEAKLKIDSRYRGEGSFVKIQLVSLYDGKNIWWAECQLNNLQIRYNIFFCNIYYGPTLVTPKYEYQTADIVVDYDIFHLARMEMNPDTGLFKFFLDGELVGSHMPDSVNQLRKGEFFPQIGSWTGPEEVFIGYFDDVSIGN